MALVGFLSNLLARFSAYCRYRRNGLTSTSLRNIRDRDPRAAVREFQRRLTADTRCRSGNESNFSLELPRHIPSLWRFCLVG